jgi:Flp pilus assembly protein TadB
MILFILILLGGALTLSIYMKNKQADRERHRHERIQEKQEELIASLREKKENTEDRIQKTE